MKNNKQNENLNAVRMLGIQAVNQANSGHPGIVLGAAPIMYSLFTENMNLYPKQPKWFNRDRFILSAGHGSALLYSMLHLAGFKISIEDLKQFRQWGSITPGHPELGLTDGVEVTTGPLGQGLAMGVGMAMAEAFLAAKFNKPKLDVINHHTFVLVGDGDLQEGVSQEVISFAGMQQLHKLIVIHDSNAVQLDDMVVKANRENMHARFKAAGWNTILIKDGEDVVAISKAIEKAKKATTPTYIEVKTIIGLGASKQGTSAVHGAPLGKDLVKVEEYFNWKYKPFEVPQSTYDFYQTIVMERGEKQFKEWELLMNSYETSYPNEYQELLAALEGKWNFPQKQIEQNNPNKKQATRISSGAIFEQIMSVNPTMFGGSADLSSSTKIKGLDGDFDAKNRTGRNIMYGVREFGMTAMNNGMAAHGGILPVASGFFVFADYMKPAMRLAALMQLQTLFVLTHDSVAVGEDGPTHQPIEQLAMLRTIPNHNLIRPADYAETMAAYQIALESKTNPTSIIATRQDVTEQTHKNVYQQVSKGAYVLSESKTAKVTLIATGSEVGLAMEAAEVLKKKKIATRVVSMPSMFLFEKQEQAYKQEVLKPATLRVSIEMGTTYGWAKYVGENGLSIGIDHFGESAPGNIVADKFGFNVNHVVEQVSQAIKERKEH
ncbi:transketolase [Williamsoniiplasma lucivorax]|uniref:Transketolase n=1 Tax=Williamsoniiplasma lucivorax TaxID=209274 RepID=A0A2S5RCZ5_9MOLU|nr:transketolase [Williamsoniiplasma lucivorax]PPE05167.1 transketolase [Williamsoniiplasma lucivorax]